MKAFPILVAAVALSVTGASDAFAQRGLGKGGLKPAVYDSTGKPICCSVEPVVFIETCSGFYQACLDGYGRRGATARGLRDCGAARAACLRTGTWDTRPYGPYGRYLASVQRR
jgi:hypothetical protein